MLSLRWLWRRRGQTDRRVFLLVGIIPLLAIGLTLWQWPHWLVFQKMVASLLMPVGLVWLLLALGVLLSRGLIRGGAMTAFVLYTLAGNAWLGGFLVASLERSFVVADPFAEAPFERVVVLGGGTDRSLYRPQAGAAGDRVVLGAQLWHAGLTPELITTGRIVEGLTDPRDLSADTQAIWARLGVPVQSIRRLPEPVNTKQEIAALAELSAAEGWQRWGLISSAWHLPRIRALCKAQGLEPVYLSANVQGQVPALDSPLYVVPSVQGFASVHLACWELLGRAVGR
jgi:uncharacterized SAM-binding protein YcdF (DUF218 family)